MSDVHDSDRLLAAWLAEGPTDIPDRVLEDAFAQARGLSQPRDRLGPLRRFIPMQLTETMRATGAPRAARYLMLAALLVIALAVAAVALVGSQQRRLPPPFGLAGNGPIAVEIDGGLVLVAIDGTRPQEIATPQRLGASPIFSPDGTQLAFFADGDVLHVAKSDGTDARVVVRAADLGLDDPDPYTPPAWSTDSSRLAIFTTRGATNVVVVADSDGTGASVIEDAGVPSWSTDGRSIAWVRPAEDGAGALEISRPDGSERRTVAIDGPQDILGFAPDGSGRLLLTTVSDAANRISIVDPASGAQTTVLEVPFVEMHSGAWSPDGTRIAANSSDGTYVVNADGSGARLLTDVRCKVRIQWSPDATRLVCLDAVASDAGRTELLIVDPDGIAPASRIPLNGAMNKPAAGFGWQRLAP
jgi:Tol biopolymer transport system component